MSKPEWNELFAAMVSRLTEMQDTAVEGLGGAADPLCALLRIARLDAVQYRNYRAEEQNDGISVTYYNTGQEPGDAPLVFRNVADNRSVILLRAFPAKDDAPWSPEEREFIGLMLRTVFHFNSRSRLLQIIDQFTYYDPYGFRNMRCFMRFLWDTADQGRLPLMNAYQLNLRHFGLINQQLGRERGDLVLRRFYDRIEALIGGDGMICRMGGDLFVILAEKRLTSDILHCISGTGIVYDDITGDSILISAAAGVFEIPEDFSLTSESDIMDPILTGTQAAKHSSTTDIVFFNQAMSMHKHHMMEVQQAFVNSLKNEEFLVYYQPKVTIEGKDLGGAEALCRWRRGGRIIPPAEFIPILEAGMEICTLDFYMLDKVCKDIRRWMDEGKPIVRISVNFSRRHMVDLHLLEHIIEIVDRNNVPHEYIEIELTETIMDVEFADLKRIVSGLQREGFCTSVDDFGIGYSSLKLIKEIPWNILKIDKSFLPATEGSDQMRRSVMFRHVISMAQALGLKCIAEGVETAEQVNILNESHCEMAQGFFFDMPLPVAEFERRLEYTHYVQ